MSLFCVDIEADGPAPGLYSMVCFGIVRLQTDLKNAQHFMVRRHHSMVYCHVVFDFFF